MELDALLQQYKTAIFEKDLESFIKLFDENVIVFDMWTNWCYEGLIAWRKMVTGWFESLGVDRDRVEFNDVRIEQNGDLATLTAYAKFTAVSEKNETLRFLDNRLTLVLRKKDGIWKIIHQHTSAPIDFASMKAILQKQKQGLNGGATKTPNI